MAIQPPKREEIEALRSSGMTRQQLATHFKVSVHTIKKWITVLGVKKKFERKIRPKKTPAIKKVDLHPYDGLTGMEKAKQVFGDRLQECRVRGYLLDGKPTSASYILEAAKLDSVALNC